jgi:glycosyltransferase involved in cell wall biosynthesis
MSASIPTSAKASSTSEQPVALLHVCTVGITARAFLLPSLQRLQDDGYDVWLACTDDADARFVAGHGIPFFPVTISRRISPRDLIAILRLYRFIRRRRFLIVNTHTSKGGFVGRAAAWLARVPCIIYTAHGYTVYAFQPRLVQWFYTLLDNWIGRRTTLFISVTERVKESLLALGSARTDNIICVHNGIDFNRFSRASIPPERRAELREEWHCDDATVVIGCAARLVPDKGLDVLLHAVARAHTVYPALRLVIAGEGELQPQLERLTAQLDLTAVVQFLGWREDVPTLMTGFDMFCLPTLREGFGYVFLEAQAMGVPVVATAIEPLTETMRAGITAVLVPPNDVERLADELARLARNPEERHRLAVNAEKHVRAHFDQEQQLQQLAAVYRGCVTHYGPGAHTG